MDFFPYNLTGPEFLRFFGISTLVCVGTALFLRLFREWFGLPATWFSAPNWRHLGPYDVAYLVGFEDRAIDAVLAKLVSENLISQPEDLDHVRRTDTEPPPVQHPLEKAVYGHVSSGKKGISIPALRAFAYAGATELRERLAARGLLPGRLQSRFLQIASVAVAALPLLVGGVRLAQGIAAKRPVLYLLLILVAMVCFVIWLMRFRPPRTHLGNEAIRQIGRRGSSIRAAAMNRPDALTGRDAALLVALLGAAALHGEGGSLNRWPDYSASSSSGGCGGGGACGGGGGCGGGGCGGCGG